MYGVRRLLGLAAGLIFGSAFGAGANALAVADLPADANPPTELTEVWDERGGWIATPRAAAGEPTEAWRFELSDRMRLDIAGDVVIIGDRDAGVINAVDSATGESRWTVPAIQLDDVSLTADGSLALVQSEEQPDGSTVTLLDTADGAILWQGTAQPGDFPDAVRVGDTVYVRGLGDHATTAIDAETGVVRWRGNDAVTVHGGVALSITDSSVGPVDPATGTRRWELADVDQPYELEVIDDVVVHAQAGDDAVTFAGYALDDGAELPTITLPGDFFDLVALGNGLTLVVSQGTLTGTEMTPDATLYAIDSRTGATIWQQSYSGSFTPISTRLGGDESVIVDFGGFGVVEAADGEILARTADVVAWQPYMTGGALLVPTTDDEVIAFDAASMEERWRVDFEGTIVPVSGGFVGIEVDDDARVLIGYIG